MGRGVGGPWQEDQGEGDCPSPIPGFLSKNLVAGAWQGECKPDGTGSKRAAPVWLTSKAPDGASRASSLRGRGGRGAQPSPGRGGRYEGVCPSPQGRGKLDPSIPPSLAPCVPKILPETVLVSKPQFTHLRMDANGASVSRATLSMTVALWGFGSWGRISLGPVLPGKVILLSVLQRGTEPWPRVELTKPCGWRGGIEESSVQREEGRSSVRLAQLGGLQGEELAFRVPSLDSGAEWSGCPPGCTPHSTSSCAHSEGPRIPWEPHPEAAEGVSHSFPLAQEVTHACPPSQPPALHPPPDFGSPWTLRGCGVSLNARMSRERPGISPKLSPRLPLPLCVANHSDFFLYLALHLCFSPPHLSICLSLPEFSICLSYHWFQKLCSSLHLPVRLPPSLFSFPLCLLVHLSLVNGKELPMSGVPADLRRTLKDMSWEWGTPEQQEQQRRRARLAPPHHGVHSVFLHMGRLVRSVTARSQAGGPGRPML